MKTAKCDGCNGRGVRSPAAPWCRIRAAVGSWIVVERCDACEQFTDDLTAALSLFKVAGWFQCDSGSFHALADSRSARRKRRLLSRPEPAKVPWTTGSFT
jgi:hypothetical protein